MRGKISKRTIDQLEPGAYLADIGIRGFTARRLPSGVVSYGFRYRDKTTGRSRWLALGLHGNVTADQARRLAQKHAGSVADRRDPVAEQERQRAEAKRAAAETVNAVLDRFLERHVRPGLRSAHAIERALDVYVRPRWGSMSIYELRRSHIVAMLDAVEDEGGPVMADRVLSYVRKAFNWRAARDDDFVPPIVPGMARTKGKDRARDRILSDEEIRELWQVLDQGGGRIVPCPLHPRPPADGAAAQRGRAGGLARDQRRHLDDSRGALQDQDRSRRAADRRGAGGAGRAPGARPQGLGIRLLERWRPHGAGELRQSQG